ncbi:MAG: response regulator, partial [Planctomycetes bacterium]|nr:response regulator [Planctomycetota bacterium]
MLKKKILIVDDEQDILELLDYNLRREGYEVIKAKTGEEALGIAGSTLPDLIILDLMLPGIDGLKVCGRLKKESKTQIIPIIMLTAKGEEIDIVTGLELGADDYITKPFSPKVLLARVQAVLRRDQPKDKENQPLHHHELIIDPARHEVLAEGKPVLLTLTEFRILEFMMKKPGRVYTRYQIVDAIRGTEYAVTDRAVDVQIVS